MATVRFGDFEWDGRKAAGNVTKHGVSFDEATTVFADLSYLLRADVENPGRFHVIGMSAFARVLTVVHVERGDVIRRISARRATKNEKSSYARRKR